MKVLTLTKEASRVALFAGLCFLCTMTNVLAAELEVATTDDTAVVGTTFTMSVQLLPDDEPVYAAEALLTFDEGLLELTEVSTATSPFTLWYEEPIIDNENGTFRFGGGASSPVSDDVTLLTLTFTALSAGVADFAFSEGAVYADDGDNTNVLTGTVGITVEVTEEASASSAVVEEEEVLQRVDLPVGEDGTPLAPIVSSQVFADTTTWYATRQGDVRWQLPTDATAVAVEVSSDPTEEPLVVYDEPVIQSITLTAEELEEGTQYLLVQFKNDAGWGDITAYQINIDQTPPESFTATYSKDNGGTLSFATDDSLSGIANYYVSPLQSVAQTHIVRAEDRAGNYVESVAEVRGEQAYTEKGSAPTVPESSRLINLLAVGIGALTLIICLLVGYLVQLRRHYKRNLSSLEVETEDVHGELIKIFAALRDEIKEQIVHITKRKKLSKREAETVDTLTKTLAVSETLLMKEVDDIRALLAREQEK